MEITGTGFCKRDTEETVIFTMLREQSVKPGVADCKGMHGFYRLSARRATWER